VRSHCTFFFFGKLLFTELISIGWVGFAFDADGMMPDHDSYVGWVDASGTATLTDRHTSVRAMPLTDVESGGSDDILSFEGSVVTIDGAEWLQFTFRRKLDTGDQFDVIVAPGAPGNLLWAIGPDNGVDYTAGTFQFVRASPIPKSLPCLTPVLAQIQGQLRRGFLRRLCDQFH
jgi:hypothetical protein